MPEETSSWYFCLRAKPGRYGKTVILKILKLLNQNWVCIWGFTQSENKCTIISFITRILLLRGKDLDFLLFESNLLCHSSQAEVSLGCSKKKVEIVTTTRIKALPVCYVTHIRKQVELQLHFYGHHLNFFNHILQITPSHLIPENFKWEPRKAAFCIRQL